MKLLQLPIDKFISSGKWRAQAHIGSSNQRLNNRFETVPLARVVQESKTAIEPSTLRDRDFFYVGLENVESITGDPLSIIRVSSESVRSRSKLFKSGDVLYGRLRPYLRKVFLAPDPLDGLCSTEFVVLRALEGVILPTFLREVLASEAVTEIVSRLQAGSALPRVSSKDLLKVEIPLPPLDVQSSIAAEAERLHEKRRALLKEAEHCRSATSDLMTLLYK